MGKRDKRVDTYIAKSADFAKPILSHLREVVHKGCPEVEETIKWGFPNFVYKGMLCNMAAFKQHCSFGFWKAPLMKDKALMGNAKSENAMRHFGRITSLADLPSQKVLLHYIKEATQLNESGAKLPPKMKSEKKELKIPDYFKKALSKNKKALKTFESFSYSNKKEYVEWITEAKSEETRDSRLQTAIEWIAEGKVQNWKYIKI